MAIQLPKDFKEFIELLNAHEVKYVLVGGFAVILHGYVRTTGDLDILIWPDVENARRMLVVLGAFGFGMLDVTEADFCKPDLILQIGRQPVRIDMITGITGVENDRIFSSAIDSELEGLPIKLISRDCLLDNKRATGRNKDLNDVEELE